MEWSFYINIGYLCYKGVTVAPDVNKLISATTNEPQGQELEIGDVTQTAGYFYTSSETGW